MKVARAALALPLMLAFGVLLNCTGALEPQPPPPPPQQPAVDNLALIQHAADDHASSALSFPPAMSEGRHPRGDLPAAYAPPDAKPFAVVSPSASKARINQRIQVVFNKAVKGARAGVPAGDHIAVEPAVAGQATWLDETRLEFVARDVLDPEQEYELTLSTIESRTGEQLEARTVTFSAADGPTIAGKTLAHLPKPGDHRVVAVWPLREGRVGRRVTMAVLFDQPTALPLARTLINLRRQHDNGHIPIRVGHPPDNQFNGAKVDRNLVVLVSAQRPLLHGEELTIVARDARQGAGRGEHSRNFEVAEPLDHTGIACAWWLDTGDKCEVEADRVRTNMKTVHVRFNNQVATSNKLLGRLVRVTPLVRNLTVANEGWGDGRLVIRGDFRPSTHYKVKLAGLADVFGNRQLTPVEFAIEMMPLGASATMPEGVVSLDKTHTEKFTVTTRNVSEAELHLWKVPVGDADAFRQALSQVDSGVLSRDDTPQVVKISVAAKRDELMDTHVNLATELDKRAAYVAKLVPIQFAFEADKTPFPTGSAAARQPVALLRPGHDESLAVHAHSAPGASLVHVAKLGTGVPVQDAQVTLDGKTVETDAQGVALINGDYRESALLALVVHGDEEVFAPIGRGATRAADLFPDFRDGVPPTVADTRGVVVTDRGIYRPGAEVSLKGSVYRPTSVALEPIADQKVKVRVVGPTGEAVFDEAMTTSDMGSVSATVPIPASSRIGLYRVELQHQGQNVATRTVRVAEFVAPRFVVDVNELATSGDHVRAQVKGRYLFGSNMGQAPVEWTLKRRRAELPKGPLLEDGLVFRAQRYWYDEEVDEAWSRAGSGTLAEDGTLLVEQALAIDRTAGPQKFVLEAQVSDSSYRRSAGRLSIVKHTASRYAGVRLEGSFVATGDEIPALFGVVDQEGKTVSGAAITARLVHSDWVESVVRGPGGTLDSRYVRRDVEVASCRVTSENHAVRCAGFKTPFSGSFRVVAEVDGVKGGSSYMWSWSDGDSFRGHLPSKGNVVQLASDKASYKAGDVAKLLVHSPYPAATVILSVESGRDVAYQAKRVIGTMASFEVPVTAAHAPHVHATVTLLPIGAIGKERLSYRIGAVRLPVSMAGQQLRVAIASDKPAYRPGDRATVTVQVHDGGTPEADAEVALAIVDEAVLRLTNHHVGDPARELRPGRPLAFRVSDSRTGLQELFTRSHTAGDGDGDEQNLANTRRKFVETALWRPGLRTDSSGKVEVSFELPDNLTEFRMMAVVLDREGKGGTHEKSFVVNKPIMLAPALPRFALVDDAFEAAVMVHNLSGDVFEGNVSLAGLGGPIGKDVKIDAGTRERIGFQVKPSLPGEAELEFTITDNQGRERDKVAKHIEVQLPGVTMRPHLAASFSGKRTVELAIPAGVLADPDAYLTVRAGQHLWPELGARLDYLLDYPHGCVEQTTSSTLPLLAARDILPNMGIVDRDEAWFSTRIAHGLKRLHSMQTRSGGLGYWPGDDDPNVYGTAYAMRAVVRAQQAGIEAPAGLSAGMAQYLSQQVRNTAVEPEVRAAIAQSLAELGALDASRADALFDLRDKTGVFGKSSLAIALSHLDGEGNRVNQLLDAVESEFDEDGELNPQDSSDFYYFGSPTRSTSQAAIALARLRPVSPKLVLMLGRLARGTDSYTTQATAYSLLALAEELKKLPDEGAKARAFLGAKPLDAHDLGATGVEFRIPLRDLIGQHKTLRLEADVHVPQAFLIDASYRAPLRSPGGEQTLVGTSADQGPDLHRVYTDAKGNKIDLMQVKAGDVVRVALLARLNGRLSRDRQGYLAITDRLPAGFEPIDPDLATVASAPDLSEEHPFANLLRWGGSKVSHLELRDDRVHIYIDRAWSRDLVATYLVRATTPGTFALPPAMAELMYEPDSASYSDSGQVVVTP